MKKKPPVETETLPGLGTVSRTLLASVGINNAADLRTLGAVAAYRRAKAAQPKRVSLNLLWAIEGALSGRDWRVVAREDRLRLLLELETAKDVSSPPTTAGVPPTFTPTEVDFLGSCGRTDRDG